TPPAASSGAPQRPQARLAAVRLVLDTLRVQFPEVPPVLRIIDTQRVGDGADLVGGERVFLPDDLRREPRSNLHGGICSLVHWCRPFLHRPRSVIASPGGA